MAARYRALLIGNSTYPADEHNLQLLRGPVKDIAVLNRALADAATGLFADTDVTLLPEVSSARAIRALGRFFGEAGRDDVLLFYFSGHGKVDQSGRLHLCMQDTETTDLLATAVSSARLNEFADASHARNVVIVLDCCFAGAFRGGDATDAVAGPGRYVLTSCRGTQLANDATAENSTSYFTQRLVDGLLTEVVDHDGDGYVTFSELYAYVNRRLREAGKQIPQRRVSGDGDLHLARRSQPAAAATAPGPEAAPAAVQPPAGLTGQSARAKSDDPVSSGPPGPVRSPVRWRGRPQRALVITAAAAATIGAGITTGLIALLGGGYLDLSGGGYDSAQTYTATAPWRLQVVSTTPDVACTLAVIDANSGTAVADLHAHVYATAVFHIHQLGKFRWRVNDRGCQVTPLEGTDPRPLPLDFDFSDLGDTPAFTAPAKISVLVKDWHGNDSCDLALFDPVSGNLINYTTVDKPRAPTATVTVTATLTTEGYKNAYLETENCGGQVATGVAAG